jgi:hypothetical protein
MMKYLLFGGVALGLIYFATRSKAAPKLTSTSPGSDVTLTGKRPVSSPDTKPTPTCTSNDWSKNTAEEIDTWEPTGNAYVDWDLGTPAY